MLMQGCGSTRKDVRSDEVAGVECRPGDRIECESRRSQGRLGSCLVLERMRSSGLGVPIDQKLAAELALRTCEGGLAALFQVACSRSHWEPACSRAKEVEGSGAP